MKAIKTMIAPARYVPLGDTELMTMSPAIERGIVKLRDTVTPVGGKSMVAYAQHLRLLAVKYPADQSG